MKWRLPMIIMAECQLHMPTLPAPLVTAVDVYLRCHRCRRRCCHYGRTIRTCLTACSRLLHERKSRSHIVVAIDIKMGEKGRTLLQMDGPRHRQIAAGKHIRATEIGPAYRKFQRFRFRTNIRSADKLIVHIMRYQYDRDIKALTFST